MVDRSSSNVPEKESLDSAEESRALAPQAKLPYSVIIDQRLSREALGLLAYRATFAGEFALERNAVHRMFGFGPDRFVTLVGEIISAGYLRRRRANDGTRHHARIIETLVVPVSMGDNIVTITQSQTCGNPLHLVGLYIYVMARQTDALVTARDISHRFGCDYNTARFWLKEAVEKGILERLMRPTAKSHMHEYYYRVLNLAEAG